MTFLKGINRPVVSRWCTTYAALCLIVLSGTAIAEDALDEVSEFDIPPQLLADALLDFSKQAELQIVMASATVKDFETSGVSGELTNRDALEQLLEDQRLEYTEHSDRTVAVQVANKGKTPGKSLPASNQILMAQTQTPARNSGPVGTTDSNSERAVLDELIVTAQKREQSIQDIGITITAFTGEELKKLGIEDASELAFYVPGLYTATSFGDTLQVFSIRGVTQNDFNDHGEAPTVVYICPSSNKWNRLSVQLR